MNHTSAPDVSELEGLEDQALIPEKVDWLGIGQLAFSSLAAVILVGFSSVSVIITLFQNTFSSSNFSDSIDLSPYLFASGLGAIGFLLIPSAVSAGRRLFGRVEPGRFDWKRIGWSGYLAPLLLLLGFWIQTSSILPRGLLPFVHVLANTAGVVLLLNIARKGLPDQTTSLFWGNLASGLGLTPLVVFVLEFIILVGIGLIWTLLLGVIPEFRQDLIQLGSLFRNQSPDSQELQRVLGEFVARPGVLFTLFGYIAILIPVVEEIFKPAAVWLLLREKLQPWEGFLLGATSGAGYALFENLTIGSIEESWTFVALTRLGTAALHIFTAGLVGWGLVKAFKAKKYGKLAGSFTAAVGLHGIWNGLNILSSVGQFLPVRAWLGPIGSSLADYAPAALIILALGCAGGIFRANKTFRRAIMAGIN